MALAIFPFRYAEIKERIQVNKDFAWLLGYLLSDGSIVRPKRRGKGDETHLVFICKYSDKEILAKVKKILGTRARIHEYPEYTSPQAKLEVFDRRDIIEDYNDIKERVPVEAIKGYERHFIRGLFDGDGTLSTRHRNGRDSFRIGFIDEVQEITQWVGDTITSALCLDKKVARWVSQNNVWEVLWEGNIARLIAYWLYHGDTEECCLSKKRQKYLTDVLNNQSFDSCDDELLWAAKATKHADHIEFALPHLSTLPWCKRVQNLLSYNTVPVFHNKGRRKYYNLYIPPKVRIANMQDASEHFQK